MGEYAELSIDGTVCMQCGQFIDSTPVDHPRRCRRCREARNPSKRKGTHKCKHCGKVFADAEAVTQHANHKHNPNSPFFAGRKP